LQYKDDEKDSKIKGENEIEKILKIEYEPKQREFKIVYGDKHVEL